MKRIIFLIAALFFIAAAGNEAAATIRIKIKPVQYYYHSGSFAELIGPSFFPYSGDAYSIGIAFEHAGEHGRFGMQHNLDLDFQQVHPLLRYKPDFKIYLLKDAPDGLYVAPYLTIGATTGKAGSGRETLIAYGGGGAIGYQFMFGDDKFSVEAQVAMGMSGMYYIWDPGNSPTEKQNDIGFGLIPHLAFGFHF